MLRWLRRFWGRITAGSTPPRSEVAKVLADDEPLSTGHRPRLPVTGFWASSTDQPDLRQMLSDVEAMLATPRVKICMAYYRSGIAGAEVVVTKASSDEVKTWAQDEVKRFWTNHLAKYQRVYDYGRQGLEPMYGVRDGLVCVDDLIDFHALTTTVLTRNRKYAGFRLKHVEGAQTSYIDLPGPIAPTGWGDPGIPGKAVWAVHQPRYNPWYGLTQLYGAWKPWRRLEGRQGAVEITDHGVYRWAMKPPIGRVPPRSDPPRPPAYGAEGRPKDNFDKMNEMLEQVRFGTAVTVSSALWENSSERQWDIDFPDHVLDVTALLGYEDHLEKRIALGIEFPPELIEAMESGGWSGRMIPQDSFLNSQDGNARAVLRDWKQQLGDPLCRWNFGPEAWFEAEVVPLAETKRKQAKAAEGGGDKGGGPEGQGPGGQPPDQKPPTPEPPKPIRPPEQFSSTRPAAGPEVIRVTHFGPDLRDDDAARALRQALARLAAYQREVRAAVRRAAESSSTLDEAARSAAQALADARPQLARLLAAVRLAGWLVGGASVADRLPQESPLVLSDPPAGLAAGGWTRERGDAIVQRLRAEQPGTREAMLSAMLPEVARWLRPVLERPATVTDLLTAAGPPPSVEDWTGSAAGDDDIRLPIIDEAVAALRRRRLLTRDEFDRLDAGARGEAFTVAGELGEHAIAAVRDALADAVEAGDDQRAFARRVEDVLGEGTFLSPGHMETVFRTNVQAALSEGLDRVLSTPLVNEAFPFIETVPIRDARLTPLCDAAARSGLDGTAVYARSDPTWRALRPPRHWNCRCGQNPLTVEQAAARGVTAARQWLESGKPPAGLPTVPMPAVAPAEGWAPAGGTMLSLVRFAIQHAPAGATVGGKPVGGQFVSDEQLAQATPEERAKLEGKVEGKPDKAVPSREAAEKWAARQAERERKREVLFDIENGDHSIGNELDEQFADTQMETSIYQQEEPADREKHAKQARAHLESLHGALVSGAERLASLLESLGGDGAKVRDAADRLKHTLDRPVSKAQFALGQYHEAMASWDAARRASAEADGVLSDLQEGGPDEPDEPDSPDEPDDQDSAEYAQWQKDYATWEVDIEQMRGEYTAAVEKWEGQIRNAERAADQAQDASDRSEKVADKAGDAFLAAWDRVGTMYEKAGESITSIAQKAAEKLGEVLDGEEEDDPEPEEPDEEEPAEEVED